MMHPRVREALLPILPAALEIARRHGLPCNYAAGHRPRYVAGNLTEPDAVRVVLLLAELGSNPGQEEIGRNQSTWLEDITCDGLGGNGFRLRYDRLATSLYERNPARFLEMVWPKETSASRVKQAVITNSFWMQADASGGSIPKAAEKDFGPHLKRFVSAFPNATVVAAGAKATSRVHNAGIVALHMGALTPPGANRADIQATWKDIAASIRERLACAGR